MRKLAAFALFLAVLSFSVPSYAQSLSDWEQGVFQDIVNRWHNMLYERGGTWRPGEAEFQQIYQQVAADYNTSTDQVKDIDTKALSQEPNETEYRIYDDLGVKLNALPSEASTQDAERAHAQTANQFGISLSKLYEIEYRIEEGWW